MLQISPRAHRRLNASDEEYLFCAGENYCIYELRIHSGAEGSGVQTVGVTHLLSRGHPLDLSGYCMKVVKRT